MVPKLCSTPKKNLTRQALIDAAHTLIWANSYSQVSVDDICQDAGVQKGSLYHFFPSKADVAAAALEQHWINAKLKMEEIFETKKTARAQLLAICSEILRKQKDSFEATGRVCGCPYITISAQMPASDAGSFCLPKDITSRFLGFYERILKNAVDERLIPNTDLKKRAYEMQIYVMGAMQLARITNKLSPVGASLQSALFLLSGIDKN